MITLEHLIAIFITVHNGAHPESDNYSPDPQPFSFMIHFIILYPPVYTCQNFRTLVIGHTPNDKRNEHTNIPLQWQTNSLQKQCIEYPFSITNDPTLIFAQTINHETML
jgi:hypothetical protein